MSRQAKRTLARIFGKLEKRLNRQKHKCLVPGCSRNAIGSHSQQKEGQLRAIARNGQVYTLERNSYRLHKGQDQRESPLLLSLSGLKKASVFPGFCSQHDAALFSPIEKHALCQNSPDQAYCLFLRAISYEFTQKRRWVSWMKMLIEEASDQKLPFDYEYTEAALAGIEYFIDIDAPYYFSELFREDDAPVTEWLDWSWHLIPKCLGASCTCCFSPLQGQHESYMEEHFGEPQPLVTFSLIPQKNETHVVICWHSQHQESTKSLKERLNSGNELEMFINECAIAESEDTCINPNIWESATEQEQNEALHAMRHQHFRGELENIPKLIRI